VTSTITARCHNCNREYTHAARRVTQRFCSSFCVAAWKSLMHSLFRVCETCGEVFRRPVWALDSGRFCSRRCYAASLVGRGNPRFIDGLSITDRRAYMRLAGLKRRALERGNGGSFTWDEWLDLKAEYSFTCPACGLAEPVIQLTVDHIVPIVNGGRHSRENIQPLCRACNRSKYTKTIRYALPGVSVLS
jgi:hypothetical protein